MNSRAHGLHFARSSTVALAAAMLWGLAVVGHPMRWEREIVLMALATAIAVALVSTSVPMLGLRALRWVATLGWLVLVIEGATTESEAQRLAVNLARQLLAWLSVVLPLTAGLSVSPLPSVAQVTRAQAVLSSFAMAIAIAVGLPPTLAGVFADESRAWTIIVGGLVVIPFAIAAWRRRSVEVEGQAPLK